MKLFSFVLAFSQAEEGGALEIFNLKPEQEGQRIAAGDRSAAKPDLDGVEKVSFRLDPGDMIIFSSGHYLHRVTPVSRRENSLDRLQLHGREQSAGPSLLLGLSVPPAVPRYFDYLIDGVPVRQCRAGTSISATGTIRHRSTTACSAQEFEDAQARLTDVLIGLADLQGRPDRARCRLRFRRHARSGRQMAGDAA